VDDEYEYADGSDPPPRCPDGCPNAGAPYCPAHEDPAIYRRDEMRLHLAEAYAHNAAREMIYGAVGRQRERRKLKEVRLPTRVMDEWIVFTTKVVLDSGEYTAQGEIERKVSAWLDRAREQDWDRLDRIKERYMRFTSDSRLQEPAGATAAVGLPKGPAKDKQGVTDRKRTARPRRNPVVIDPDPLDDEF